MISYSGQARKQTQIQNESTSCQKAKQGGLRSANPILFRFTPWTKNLLQQIQSNYIFNKKLHFHFVSENWYKVQLTTFRNQYLSAGVVSGIATVSIGEIFHQMKWRKWKIVPFGHCVTYNVSHIVVSWIYRNWSSSIFLSLLSENLSYISDPGTVLGFSAILLPQLGQVGCWSMTNGHPVSSDWWRSPWWYWWWWWWWWYWGIFSPQFDRVGHQKNGLTIATNSRNAKNITPKYVSKYISHFLLHTYHHKSYVAANPFTSIRLVGPVSQHTFTHIINIYSFLQIHSQAHKVNTQNQHIFFFFSLLYL